MDTADLLTEVVRQATMLAMRVVTGVFRQQM